LSPMFTVVLATDKLLWSSGKDQQGMAVKAEGLKA